MVDDTHIKINLKGDTLHRGVPPGKPSYKDGIPQWFSHDSNHDYIIDPAHEKRTINVVQDIMVINLKHPLVHNLLNVAIDKLKANELIQIINVMNNNISPTDKENYIDVNTVDVKAAMKSVYGGVSLHEQLKAMSDDKIKERMTKIDRLPHFLKQYLGMSAFRYSYGKYDRLLMILIVHVFAKQYKFFEDIRGWYHSDWNTPWHDKKNDKTQIFISEVAISTKEGDLKDITTTGGKLLRHVSHPTKKVSKPSSKKATVVKHEDSNRIRPPSRKVRRPEV